jgi:outer membrane protein OmpA-like peptidoglycan-associated protein
MLIQMKTNLMVIALCVLLVHAAFAEPRPKHPVACDVFFDTNVEFSFKSSEIPASQVDKLKTYIAKIRKADFCPLAAVIVIGHADATEASPQGVILLSKKRAENVSLFIVNGGIPHDFMQSISKGSEQPVIPASSAQNARVEVRVAAGCPSDECNMFPISEDGFRRPMKRSETK